MEKDLKFSSAICTSRSQSERLLALGIKKETADCRHWAYTKDSKGNPIPKRNQRWFTRIGTDESAQVCGFMDTTFLPAWSLHRLLCLLPKYIRVRKESFGRFKWVTLELTIDAEFVVWYREDIDNSEVDENFYAEDIYTSLCDCIEWLIKEGYFPKEYLVDQEALEERCKGVLEYLDYIRGEE